MLRPDEKAYCQALLALRQKDYRAALRFFDAAAPGFSDNREFSLYREATRLLLAVKDKLAELENKDTIDTKETVTHGQETELR
ncbi:MAG TPA: hypothetical protein PLR32_07720 [candidate division Zixibacteria bacterium]|nr:hypothetical protein [candidate division Zixibacteria bacterium]MDD4917373.1 hypothetical protein [candidate division Zixibacteria bacterium]MDM7971931.1 hypothetical protein [candidate division Zixibacteria bacterium]HOD66235.1 hypothetical protein [candidate division Zixibacteria bacterium]HPI33188.1 hypothetical protein [candidate division Zixibacteria bacterium]